MSYGGSIAGVALGAKDAGPVIRAASPLSEPRGTSPKRNPGGEGKALASGLPVTSNDPEAELAVTRAALDAERRRSAELEGQLARTGALLREADHRMRNSLQVIASLMLLKAKRIEGEASKRALQSMAELVSALATVQRLQAGAERPDAARLLAELATDVTSVLDPGRIEIALDLAPVPLAAAKASSLALIVHELLANAVRHAFPGERQGLIRVVAEGRDGELCVVVADDGVGIHGAPQPGAFGRTLVEMLVRQLRGRVAWCDAEPGTRAVVDIPLSPEERHP